MGWDTEESAVTQYGHYEATGEIPYKLRIQRQIILLNGSVVGQNPLPPRHASPQVSPIAPRSAPALSHPTFQPASPLQTTPTRHRRAATAPHTTLSDASPPAATGSSHLYYVVLEGHAPGVYKTQ